MRVEFFAEGWGGGRSGVPGTGKLGLFGRSWDLERRGRGEEETIVESVFEGLDASYPLRGGRVGAGVCSTGWDE